MRLSLAILLFSMLPCLLQAQPGNVVPEEKGASIVPLAVGGSLTLAGAAFTFQPGLNSLQTSLRDALQSDGHQKLAFDDVLQFSPLVMAPVLNMAGLKSRHSLQKIVLLESGSYLLGYVLVQATKYDFHIHRPEGIGVNSFPSGHTFIAFAGAELLRREYGRDYPLLAAAGYAVASLVGSMRLYNNRHWLGDVLSGAGIGIISVGINYWLFD